MQECETSTGKKSFAKRVTVRSGGAGHAHSGVARPNTVGNQKTIGAPADERITVSRASNGKIVRLGR